MAAHTIPNSWSEILETTSPLVCGILNVTPDSFSDGSQFISKEDCENQIEKLVSDGAHIVDVGAESTKPGSKEVMPMEEERRLGHAFRFTSAHPTDCLYSIDTRHSATAQKAIDNGFHIINDVSGALFDPEMRNTMADTHALCILMHMRGTPETMMDLADFDDVVDDVTNELHRAVDAAIKAGVKPEKIMIDPGIGFGKRPVDNLTLIEKCSVIKERLSLPIMVGLSRKSVVSVMLTGNTTSAPMAERDVVTAQLSAKLADQGVDAIRVHDVARTVHELRVRN